MAAEAKFMQQGRARLMEAEGQSIDNTVKCSDCVSCGQGGASLIITRVCGSHCEGHECSCVDVKWCSSCVLQHIWHDTKGGLKSFARCPTCRAEFCMDDVHTGQANCNKDVLCGNTAEHADHSMDIEC